MRPFYLLIVCFTVALGADNPVFPDAIAFVDKLFTYVITSTPSSGNEIKVTESGHARLPAWLAYNTATGMLEGVPGVEDRGTYVISVNGDLFAINVRFNSHHTVVEPTKSRSSAMICKPEDSVMRVTVAVDTDVQGLTPHQRARLIRDVSDHLSVQNTHVSLKAERQGDVLDPSSALVSGRGNRNKKAGELGALLSWVVGCSEVKSHQMDILEHLESSAQNGLLSRDLGIGVNGWQVTMNRPSKSGKRRLKREVVATPIPGDSTSTPRVTPPSTAKIPIPPPPPRINRPPVLRSEVSTPIVLSMTSGQLYAKDGLDEYFVDPDADKITIEVVDYVSSRVSGWLRVDRVSNSLIGLPMPQHIGTNKFMLRARDRKGSLSVDVQLTVNVRKPSAESVGQWYKMKVASPFNNEEGQLLDLVYSISKRHIDDELRVDSVQDNVVTFGVATEGEGCPHLTNSNHLVMLRGIEKIKVGMLSDLEEVKVIDVRTKPLPPCEDGSPSLTPNQTVISQFNRRLKSAVKGVIFHVPVPQNLFVDTEDIDLRYMKLDLLTQDLSLEDAGWLYLDRESQTLVGLPFDTATPKDYQYELKAIDSSGKHSSFNMEIHVSESEEYSSPTNQITVELEGIYSKFANDLHDQIMVYDQLSRAFASSRDATIFIDSIKSGSVIISFSVFRGGYNPESKISCGHLDSYINTMFTSDKSVKPEFYSRFGSYSMIKASFASVGDCDGYVDPIVGYAPGKRTGPHKEEQGGGFNMLYVIIPVVLIVVVVALVVVAIVLMRRKKKESRNITNSNGKYIESGVPVMLDEDMKIMEQDEPTVTEPLLHDEKPKPPAYPQNGCAEASPLTTGQGTTEQSYPTPPTSENDDTDR